MPWHIFEPFVLRTTGFPFAALLRLRLDNTVTALDKVDTIDDELDRLRAVTWQSPFAGLLSSAECVSPKPRRQIKALCALRAALKHGLPLPVELVDDAADAPGRRVAQQVAEAWNTLLNQRELAWREAQRLYTEESDRLRSSLWQMAADPALQEAVFLSSPSASAALCAYMSDASRMATDNSKSRALERVAFSYLQRLCAKNDTASFFGPVNYGRFDPTEANALQFEAVTARPWTRRKAFLSHWSVSALAAEIGRNDAVMQHQKPRRSPLVSTVDQASGSFVHHGSGQRFNLPRALARLLAACDGQHAATALAVSLDMPLDTLLASLRRMVQLRLVDCALPIESTAVDALDALCSAVHELPSSSTVDARRLTGRAEQLRQSFQEAAWPERRRIFQATETWLQELGVDARRNAGELYGDRLALYEDCAGSLDQLRVGGSLYQRLTTTLLPLMEFLTGAALLRRLDAQEAVRAQLDHVPSRLYIDLVRNFQPPTQPGPRERELQARLRSLLDGALTDDGIQLDAAALRQTLAPWQALIDRQMAAFPLVLPSPDLMVSARSRAHLEDGEFQLVLAEIHDDCSTVFAGFFAQFHDRPQALRELLDDHIRNQPGWQGLATILGNRRSKHVTPELPGTTIHLSGVSTKGDAQVVPVCEVVIEDDADGLHLRARGQRLQLYPGDVRSAVHMAFSLPSVVPLDWLSIWGRDHLPRLTLDGLVVQRATWQMDTASLPAVPAGRMDLGALRRLRGWVHAQGVPEWSFARWSTGEKPLLVDTRNPWSLALLQRVAKQHPRLRLTEMCPDPEHLFFDAGCGVQTFELRMALSRVQPLHRTAPRTPMAQAGDRLAETSTAEC